MERPLGLISVLMFLGGIGAFLIFRDLNPKASVTSFWFVFIGCIGLAYEASQTMRLNPDLTPFSRVTLVGPSADVRPTTPSPASHSSVGRPDPGRPLPGGSSTPAASSGGGGSPVSGGASSASGGAAPATSTGGAPKSGNASAPPGGQQDDGSSPSVDTSGERATPPSSIHWVSERVVSEERVTGNHKCAEVPGAANPMACKTGYTIALTCDAGKRLTAPQLHCTEGDCAASAITDVRISPDGRRVDARFEVWGTATRWQLTAVREESVVSTP